MPLIDKAYAPQIATGLNDARATLVRTRLIIEGFTRQGLALDKFINTFAGNSYYTNERSEQVHVTDASEPAAFRQLSTKDGVFVGNCEAGNVLLHAVLKATLKQKGLSSEVRKVVAVQGATYHEGEDLHAVLFVRDRSGRGDWFDGTPLLGPLNSVAATSTSTIEELITRSKPALKPTLTARFRASLTRWWSGPAEITQNVTPPTPLAAVSTPEHNQSTWAAPDALDAGVAHHLKEAVKALATLDAHYAQISRELERAGAGRVTDRTSPSWAVPQLTSLWLSFAHGRRDVTQLTAALERITRTPIDHRAFTAVEYLRLVEQHLQKYIDHVRADRERTKATEMKNILILTEQLAYELQKHPGLAGLRILAVVGRDPHRRAEGYAGLPGGSRIVPGPIYGRRASSLTSTSGGTSSSSITVSSRTALENTRRRRKK